MKGFVRGHIVTFLVIRLPPGVTVLPAFAAIPSPEWSPMAPTLRIHADELPKTSALAVETTVV